MNEIELEIRKQGQQIMLMEKMAMAMKAQGKTDAMLEQLEKIKEAADCLYTTALQHKDGIVVYVHATGFITRTLSDSGMNARAFRAGADALLWSMELIRTYNRNNILEPLPDEMECNFKTAQLLPLVVMFNELSAVKSNMKAIEEDFEPYDDLHQIFIKAMKQLKMLAPSSPLVVQATPLFNAISQMEEPGKFLNAHVDDIKSVAKSILNAIEKMPLYDSDAQAASRLSRFDGFYRDQWYDTIHGEDVEYDFSLLECLMPKFAEKINLSDPGLCIGDCNMYKSGEFNWGEYPECIFDLYRSLCQEYGVTPMTFDTYTVKDKVPYVNAGNLVRMQRDVVKAWLHLRENNVCGCGKLSAAPADEEMLDWVECEVDDFDMTMFCLNYVTFMFEVEGQVIKMGKLCIHLSSSVEKALSGEDLSPETAALEECLEGYITRLKSHGILPSDWKFTNPWSF